MKNIRYSGMRKTIAQYVRLASHRHPIHLSVEIKARLLASYRTTHQNSSYTAILMKVIARVAEKYPLLNGILARGFLKKRIFIPEDVDIACAMEKEFQGELFVTLAIIRAVQGKSIASIQSEIDYLKTHPYEQWPEVGPLILFHRLPESLQYRLLKFITYSPRAFKKCFGTVGISNLGRYGIHSIYPLWMNTVVFGVGSVEEKAVVENGTIVVTPVLHLSMSFNHSVIDGVMAARILQEIKERIERGELE